MPELHWPSQIAWRLHMIYCRWTLLIFFFVPALWAQQPPTTTLPRVNFDEILRQIPALERHGPLETNAVSAAEVYEAFLREKLSSRWFAALLPNSPKGSYQIIRRFDSWNRFMDFLQEHDA